MVHSSLARAAVSAVVVGAILATLRRATPRAGGLVAAVPISSMPALFWLSFEHGGSYAAGAALGSFWGTGLTALLGLTFARMTRLLHAAMAAPLALITIGASAALIWTRPEALTVATAFALVAILARQAARPQPRNETALRTDSRRSALFTMAIAAAMSWLVSELSQRGAAQFCGLIATVPVLGISALVAGHRQGGAPRMLRVLDGYLSGMLAKAAFLGALVVAWGAGAGLWAWFVALASAAAALLAQRHLQQVRAVQQGSNR